MMGKELSNLYWNEKKSTTQIACSLDTSHTTILRLMKKFKIPRRTISEATYNTFLQGRTHHNKGRTKENYLPLKVVSEKLKEKAKPKIRRICNICHKPFYVPSWYGKGEYCSKSCQNVFLSNRMKRAGNPNWTGGYKSHYLKRGVGWNNIKKKILERDNYACQECGGKNLLTVHHIIPYRISKDNSEENLICLCRSCHIKLDNRWRKIRNQGGDVKKEAMNYSAASVFPVKVLTNTELMQKLVEEKIIPPIHVQLNPTNTTFG